MDAVSIPTSRAAIPSKPSLWAGRVVSLLVVLFLVFDGVTKVIKDPHVLAAMSGLQLPPSLTVPIGAVLLACTALYAIPRTSALGTLLLTAYLGGAVAIQLRVFHPVFGTSFPIMFGVLVWVGLFLREPRLRALVPTRTKAE